MVPISVVIISHCVRIFAYAKFCVTLLWVQVLRLIVLNDTLVKFICCDVEDPETPVLLLERQLFLPGIVSSFKGIIVTG